MIRTCNEKINLLLKRVCWVAGFFFSFLIDDKAETSGSRRSARAGDGDQRKLWRRKHGEQESGGFWRCCRLVAADCGFVGLDPWIFFSFLTNSSAV